MPHAPQHDSQQPSRSFWDEMRQLMRLGLPIAFVQFGMTSMNFVDVALLGRHDQASLPAMTLGNLMSFGVMVFCMGAITAADPLMSQAVGARDEGAVPRLLGRTLLLSLILTVPTAALLLPAATWLELFQQPSELIPEAASYARLQTIGILPFLWYGTLRSLLSAHARLAPQVLTIVAGNLANFALDCVFIFGAFGLPEMGATGAGLTTVICRWLMLIGLCAFGWRDIGPHLCRLGERAVRARAFALAPLWRMLKLGTPIGVQFALEWGAFGAVGLLVGVLETLGGDHTPGQLLGGHQITMMLASLSFMVPLGLGIAASVRVGWAVGRRDAAAVKRSVFVALCAAAAVMTAFMLLFLLLPAPLAALLAEHEPMIAVAVALIPIAGVFQIGDGLQVVAVGCLRGLGDMRSAVVANLVGFWLLGLTIGCGLAFWADMGPAGLWWGLAIGLFTVAVGLLWVLRARVSQDRERLQVD
ncbi:MAG: MATE family efflux transporter [Planctomycetota bacterium]|nr:MATE family efflux transporter [Planctomycetota bacterium]